MTRLVLVAVLVALVGAFEYATLMWLTDGKADCSNCEPE